MTDPEPIWKPAGQALSLPADTVDVWRASLEPAEVTMSRLAQDLSADERERAGRKHYEQDRWHFIAGRGMLRSILGGYLGLPPGHVRFRYGPHGKPALEGGSPANRLTFSLSHSHGQALFAVSLDREVGIDLEWVRPMPEAERIAERHFAPTERAQLRSLPAGLRDEAFFQCWTRKEACLKASGDGLMRPLDSLVFSVAQADPDRFLSVQGEPQEASQWLLEDLAPAPGYVAALAVEGRGWHIRRWEWVEPAGPRLAT